MRIVITTVAFGMGIQIPDIDLVIHWGPSDNSLMYWHEVGRCARDVYLVTCLRKVILKTLQIEGIPDSEIDSVCGGGNQCCTYCNDFFKLNQLSICMLLLNTTSIHS